MVVKKILAASIAASLLASVAPASAAINENANQSDFKNVETKQLTSSNGEYLGTEKKVVTITRNDDNGNVKYTMVEEIDYTLAPEYQGIPAYERDFKDRTDINTYEITASNQFIVNNQEVSLESSKVTSQVQASARVALAAAAADKGGIPTHSHYYSTADLQTYTFATYSNLDWSGTAYAAPAGSHAKKTVKRTNMYYQDAKSSIDMFTNDYNDFVFDYGSFLVLSGLSAATLETLVGWIPFAGGAGFQALQAYNSYQDAKSNIGKAYLYVNAM
ncbi:hypothetical protein [Paenibacillus sp. B01]|uniref:hypothetical protein n=1 Tax=Paenibacillus sp. B01 TaxID=2660554 RepID=UPI00129A4F11|nr:hypothetical protein [Paenibacillus sp. B01]QGG54260.1 hypothetical protein GE073_00630 [Paenibacillus sp. B01]